jgi:hypothetical protein
MRQTILLNNMKIKIKSLFHQNNKDPKSQNHFYVKKNKAMTIFKNNVYNIYMSNYYNNKHVPLPLKKKKKKKKKYILMNVNKLFSML